VTDHTVTDHSGSAIRATGVSKRFTSYHRRSTSLKERMVRRNKVVGEDFWALRDIDVSVGHGETVGLIGANGSGKSTLLKMLAGILRPTSGEVQVNGRIASLLELGAGFNGELSGRDNVYLNASLLGLTRRETDRLFDDIVAFSELENFIDNAVKHYSSGMYVRLGFAVAVHVDPDVLLVDEVLAVGDEAFQKKCLDQIAAFQADGRTILFVSHSLDLVEKICDRSLVLDHGRLLYDGSPPDGSRFLRGRLGTIGDAAAPAESGGSIHIIRGVFSAEPGGPPKPEFDPGEPMTVSVLLDVEDSAPSTADLRVAVIGPYDIPIWSMTGTEIPMFRGRGRVDFTLPALPSVLGTFTLSVGVTETGSGRAITAKRLDDVFTLRGEQRFGLLEVPYRRPVPIATQISISPEASVSAQVGDSLPTAGA
jgi:ABC-2 type transport system ATP-binding protein